MDKKEVKEKIKELRAKMKELVERGDKSQDIDEVRSIGEMLKTLRDEINDLEKQLEDSDDGADESASRSGVPANAQLRNGDIVKGIFTGTADVTEGLALRSDESFMSRIKGDRSPLDIGKYVRGIVTGNWENADAERRAVDTTATGVIIPAVCSAGIIDYARNASLFGSAGVPTYNMESNNLKLARLATDPVFKFKEEGASASESSFSLDSVDLEAKTCYGYCYVSLEAIESAKNLTDIIIKSFGQAMATTIDKIMLYGQYNTTSHDYDDFAPSGIMNDTDIHTIEATNSGYRDIVKAIGAVRASNGTPTVFGMNAQTEERMSLLTDDNGQILAVPKAYEDLIKIVSNQLAYDSTDKVSDAIVFDPKALAIGIQNNLRFKMITDSDECIKKGLVCFRIYSMVDCKAVRPTHIAKITGIADLESV